MLPSTIVAQIATSALSTLLASTELPEESTSGLIKVLNQLYQRWPLVWESETRSRTASGPDEHLWRIMNRVLGAGADAGIVLSNASPDPAVRVVALKELLAATELHTANPAFVHESLLARLSEPVVEVAQAVLDIQTLDIVNASLSADEILAALEGVLASPKLDDKLFDVVLPYLAGPFLVAHPDKTDEVVESIFWNRILSRKGAAKERAVVATALATGPASSHAWLAGVGKALASASEPTLEQATAAHAAVVQQIATNIAALDLSAQGPALEFLLATSSAEDASVLSLLVLVQLSSKLAPAQRIELASSVFAALSIEQVSLDALTGAEPESFLDKTSSTGPTLSALLAQAVLTRPQAPKTLRRVRAALLSSTVASLRPLSDHAWSWLSASSTSTSSYRALGRTIYALAHTGTTVGAADFARDLLSSLFTSLAGDDALAFLSSVWTDSATPAGLRTIALRDAKVFVEVQAIPALKKAVDCQTVVPAVVVALMDGDKHVRAAAIEVLEAVVKAMPKAPKEVYGRDAFYGRATSCALFPALHALTLHLLKASTAAIKYLDPSDALAYISALLAARVELAMDGTFLLSVHASLPSESKKASLKLKASTFLLSHAAAWPSVFARTLLLRSLSGVREPAKNAHVVDILAEVVKAPAKDSELVVEYGRLLLQPFEGVTRKFLEADDGKALAVFFSALAITDRTGAPFCSSYLECGELTMGGQARARLCARRLSPSPARRSSPSCAARLVSTSSSASCASP